MPYQEFKPSEGPADHIAAYWVRKTSTGSSSPGRRVYADGCADIIFNTGNTTAWFHPKAPGGEKILDDEKALAGDKALAGETIPLLPGKMYLGGTMTAYGVVTAPAGCILTGIRFKPGGFYALYRQPMSPAVDSLLAFDEAVLQSLMAKEEGLASRLDTYFSTKEVRAHRDFSTICKMIYGAKGQMSVEALSKDCHMSNRTMERVFKINLGIPPKEFIQIVRFQEVLSQLRQLDQTTASRRESLLRIAFELGYHDHAHLTNEFKRYAGILPSELSRFYKTGIALGQYF